MKREDVRLGKPAHRWGSLHGAFAAAAGVRGTGAVLALASNVLLARLLGVAEYGSYMALLSAAMILGGVAVRGTNQLLTREVAATAGRGTIPVSALRRWGTRRVAVGTALGAGAFMLWAYFQPGAWSSRAAWSVIGAGVLVLGFSAICTLGAGVLNGFGASTRSQAVVLIAQKGLLLVLLGVLWVPLSGHAGADLALWLQAGTYAVAAVLAWLWIKSVAKTVIEPGRRERTSSADRDRGKGWSKASRRFMFVSIASLLVARLDVILVSSLAGNQVAGIYAAGARVAQVAMIAAVGINIVLSPRISAAWASGQQDAVKELLRKALVLTAPIAVIEVIMAVLCAPLLGVFLGHAYVAAGPVFLLIMIAYALWTLAAPGYALLAMTGKESIVAYLSWLVLIVNMGMIALLVPREGALGAGAAMIVGYAVVLPFMLFSVKKIIRVKPPLPTTPSRTGRHPESEQRGEQ